MQAPSKTALKEEQEISLYDLGLMVRSRWRLLFATTAAAVFVALAVALFSAPVYRAEVVLAPVSQDADGVGVPALGGGLGGLASLAGLGGAGVEVEQNVAILRSRALANRFISERNLRPFLFYDRWDGEAGRWKKDEAGWFGVIRRLFDPDAAARDPQDGPTADESYRSFDDIRSVDMDSQSGLVTLAIEWRDPELAAQWANGYVKAANDYVRVREIAESRQRLDYLEDQARLVTVTEVKGAITSLMESELKKSMIANVRQEYAFKLIDPAVVPELRVWPRRTLIVALGFVGGVFLGTFLVLFLNYLSVMRNARSS